MGLLEHYCMFGWHTGVGTCFLHIDLFLSANKIAYSIISSFWINLPRDESPFRLQQSTCVHILINNNKHSVKV